jgi:plastocyanin domain-containing protein
MTADDRGYTPNVLYVQKGVPVKWVIDGAQINSCNNQIIVPALNIKKKLAAGEMVIEFTPQDQDLNFSCWMGMIKGLIRVVDDVNAVDISKENINIPKSSGCCGGGGANSSCCSSEGTESIYNSDITQEPTERIIKKASVAGNAASVTFTGKGVEFEPLIVVINKNMPTRINFDLTGFDRVEGTWEIVDYQRKQVVKKFMFTQKNYEFTFDQPTVGTYIIYQDRSFKGIIEVVDDLAKTDPEKIREKLFKNK